MKQLRQFLLMILLLVSADVMTAQQTRALFSISGKVVDAKTGEPVIGAAVNVEDTGIWAISDEKGTFCRISDLATMQCSSPVWDLSTRGSHSL